MLGIISTEKISQFSRHLTSIYFNILPLLKINFMLFFSNLNITYY